MSESVGLGINPPPSGFDMLNTILGIQQKKIALQQAAQSLQTGQYLQQTAAAGAQQNTQEMNERILMQRAVQDKTDPNTGESLLSNTPDPTTGKIDLDPMKLARFAQNSLPLTGQAVQQQIMKTQSDRAGLAGSVLGLNNEVQDKATSVLRAHIHDPEATGASIGSELDNAFQGVNTPAAQGASMYTKNMLSLYDKTTDQTKRDDILSHLAQAYDPAAAQRLLKNPTYTATQTKQGIQQVQTNPLAAQPLGPAGAPVVSAGNQGVAPSLQTMPDKTLQLVGPAGPGGAGAGAAPPQTKLQPLARPNSNDPAAYNNYQAQIAAATQDYASTAAAANEPLNGVQATRYRNQQILDLIPHADTGPYMKMLNVIASRVPGSSGDAYQVLEHNTAANSAAIAGKLGVPNTNLGSETSAAIAGNVERNPGALAEISKQNDALNTGFDLYNRGLAKVTNNGSDMSRAASYKQAFGANMDVNALRWADAHRRHDDAEITKLQQQFGDQGIAAFGQKLRVLKSLSENGDLP